MPASFGVHGPGDSTIASGLRASASATVSLSLRHDLAARADVAQEVDEVEGESVVVVDEQDHGGASLPRRWGRVNAIAIADTAQYSGT